MTHLLYMQHWSKLSHHAGEPCPVGRAAHATVCLGYGGDQPQLLVTGGMDGDDNVLSDVWLLDVETRRWREVRVWGVRSVLESGSDHYHIHGQLTHRSLQSPSFSDKSLHKPVHCSSSLCT